MPSQETSGHRWRRAALRFVVAWVIFLGLKACAGNGRPLARAVVTAALKWSRISSFGLGRPVPGWFDFPRAKPGSAGGQANELRIRERFGWHSRGRRTWFVPGIVVRATAGSALESMRAGLVTAVGRTAGGWTVTVRVAPGLHLTLSGLAAVTLQTGRQIRPATVVGTAGARPFTVQAWDQGYPVNPHLAHLWVRVREGAG